MRTDWKLKNFIMIQKLGDGQFGNVFLVKDCVLGKYYALKCVSLKQIIDEKIEEHVIVTCRL